MATIINIKWTEQKPEGESVAVNAFFQLSEIALAAEFYDNLLKNKLVPIWNETTKDALPPFRVLYNEETARWSNELPVYERGVRTSVRPLPLKAA